MATEKIMDAGFLTIQVDSGEGKVGEAIRIDVWACHADIAQAGRDHKKGDELDSRGYNEALKRIFIDLGFPDDCSTFFYGELADRVLSRSEELQKKISASKNADSPDSTESTP